MEYKRLRKGKTVKTEDMSFLADKVFGRISDALRKQTIETIKIPQEYEDECNNIKAEGYEVLRISRNLNEYCAVLAGKDEPGSEIIELSDCLDFICKKSRPFMEKYEIRLLCKLPGERIFINSSEEKFAYAVMNILRNSVEHTFTKGKIKVVLSKSKRFARVVIKDNGEGIDEESLLHCREPLFTGDPSGKRLGLGLTLAEHFIKSIGGRVKVRSEKGKGTSVSLFIPLAEKEDLIAERVCLDIREDELFIPAYISFSGIERG